MAGASGFLEAPKQLQSAAGLEKHSSRRTAASHRLPGKQASPASPDSAPARERHVGESLAKCSTVGASAMPLFVLTTIVNRALSAKSKLSFKLKETTHKRSNPLEADRPR